MFVCDDRPSERQLVAPVRVSAADVGDDQRSAGDHEVVEVLGRPRRE